MKAMISVESYTMVQKLANKFCYGNTRSLKFDHYVSVGLDALTDAVETYKENDTTQFSTYAYRCVLNAMVNEQKRMLVHELPQDENIDVSNDHQDHLCGAIMFNDGTTAEFIKDIISKAVGNDRNKERNAHIVELYIGLECEPIDLKDIAAMYDITHECARLVCVKTLKKIREHKQTREVLYGLVG